MNWVFKNKSAWHKYENMCFGLAELVDGLVRIVTLGHFCTTLPLSYSRNATQRVFTRMKDEAYKNQQESTNV